MKRLIRSDRFREKGHSLSNVEDPFFAVSIVKFYLYIPDSLPGLNDLIKECPASGFCCHRPYDEKHRKQVFLQADDHWAVKGSSWHWVPAIADTIYERSGGDK